MADPSIACHVAPAWHSSAEAAHIAWSWALEYVSQSLKCVLTRRCAAHSARLKKLGSPLLFRLRLQEFTSLIQRDSPAAALRHARTHLQPFAHDPARFPEFKTAFALVVVTRRTRCARYTGLLAPERWQELAELFVGELLRAHSLCTVPLLELQLQVRLGM